MSVAMQIKQLLRKRGYDIVRYRSFWDDIVKPLNPATIIDIGANDGSFAERMRTQFPNGHIISFEPLQGAYKALTARMAGDSKFTAYNLALGDNAGESVIYKSASDPSSSLLPMAELHKKLYPHTTEHAEEKIQIDRLDSVLSEKDLAKPVLVKIDVQGFEAAVIRGGRNILREADIVLVENSFVTLYEGQALFGDVHDLMRSLGFEYHGRSETHYNEKTKEPIYEDSVFMKSSRAS
jgi:FkbM family methyltransferase